MDTYYAENREQLKSYKRNWHRKKYEERKREKFERERNTEVDT